MFSYPFSIFYYEMEKNAGVYTLDSFLIDAALE